MKMAQQQAPPAAQAPIVVVVDEVQITSDAMLVLVPGAQHVKDHTPCLSWTTVYDNAGAVTNYTLGQSDAKGAFLPRCRFSVDQQTGTLPASPHTSCVWPSMQGEASPSPCPDCSGISSIARRSMPRWWT